MRVDSAIHLIESVMYKPGWQFSAEDHTNRYEGAIKLRVDYEAQNSDRPDAFDGYPTHIQTYASFPIIVGDCDDTTLWRRMLTAVAAIDSHEAREFFRVRPTGWAPFHPHNIDGMKRWGDMANDIQFGLA